MSMTLAQFSEAQENCYKLRLAVHAKSKPGVGKTDVITQTVHNMSKKYNVPFGLHTLHLSCIDSIDAEGIRMPTTIIHDGKEYQISGTTRSPLLPPLGAPERGFVFLDEVMQGTSDVLKPVARFVNERRIGEHKLEPGWSIVMASNYTSDKAGVTRGMTFLTNRQMIVDIKADVNVWVEWALANKVHPLIIAYAKYRPQKVFDGKLPDDPDEPFLSPRSLVNTGRVLTVVESMELASEMVAGLIGKGSSGEVMGFIRMADQLPEYEEIIRDPEGTPAPNAPDAIFAACQMIAHKVTPDTAVPAFKWLKKLPRDFQVTCLREAMARPDVAQAGLLANEEFTKWVQDHSHLVIAASGGGSV